MKIIGFSIEEILAKRPFEIPKAGITTDIVFTNIDKAKLDVLKEEECLKGSFKFSVVYKDASNKESKDNNEIALSGSILLMVTKEESKEFIKLWKSKQIPKDKIIPIYNYILKKCSVKALQLEEELNLQPHIPFPKLTPQNTQTN